MKRLGMLTSGGDCQALNAAMRGVVKTLANGKEEVEIYGFLDGYRGLIYGNFRMLTDKDFSGILTKGGTILGTSRTPFKTIQDPDPNGLNKVEAMKQNYYKLQLDCLVILGGNGTHKTANLLRKEGLNIVTLPKTIDNDLWGTDMTFGFQSAVDIATDAIDCIHTTAASHGRVFIVEVMGHKVGWLTLNAGMAGGADIILIPEIPYDIDKVIEKIEDRDKKGCQVSGILHHHDRMMISSGICAHRADFLIRQGITLLTVPDIGSGLDHDIRQSVHTVLRHIDQVKSQSLCGLTANPGQGCQFIY
jgi:ATP-dependent phosphofructokinase / diphosphate-dependent phosphofructokinase